MAEEYWEFAAGVVDTGGNLPPASLSPVSLIPAAICHQCHWHWWQICRRCRWHRWCTLTCEYLHEFSKKFEMTLVLFSGAWGKVIHEKNPKQKISWHCPLSKILYIVQTWIFYCFLFHMLSHVHVLEKVKWRRRGKKIKFPQKILYTPKLF